MLVNDTRLTRYAVFSLPYNVFVVLIGAVIVGVVNIVLLAPIGCRWCIS